MTTLYLKTQGDSTTFLPESLDVLNYSCGLAEISGFLSPEDDEKKDDTFFLCSNITEDVFVNNIRLPVLRKLTWKKKNKGIMDEKFSPILWCKIIRSSVTKINLYITDSCGNRLSFTGKGLTCTLLIRACRKC